MKVLRNKEIIEVSEYQSGDVFISEKEDLHQQVKEYFKGMSNMVVCNSSHRKFTFCTNFYEIDNNGDFHRMNTTYLPKNIHDIIKEDLEYWVKRF